MTNPVILHRFVVAVNDPARVRSSTKHSLAIGEGTICTWRRRASAPDAFAATPARCSLTTPYFRPAHTAACRLLSAVPRRGKFRARHSSLPNSRQRTVRTVARHRHCEDWPAGLSVKETHRFAPITLGISMSAITAGSLRYTQLQPGSGTLGINSLKMFASLGLIPGLGVFPSPQLAKIGS